MRYLLFFVLFFNVAFASTLLSITASEEAGRVDIILSFDSPFDGSIEQSMSAKGPILFIGDATIEAKKEISFKSSSIKKIILSKEAPSRASLQIESDEPLNIQAQKSNDSQKLEFIVSSVASGTIKNEISTPYDKNKSEQFSKSFSAKFDQSRDAKTENELYWRYVVVIIFMAFLLIALVIVKKYYANKKDVILAKTKSNGKKEIVDRGDDRRRDENSFPIDKTEYVIREGERRQGVDPYSDFKEAHSFDRGSRAHHSASDDLQIISQKSIDANNKLVAVEYDGDKYLLVVGQNTTIVDKTATDRRAKEFEDTFLTSEKRIEGYLKSKPLSKLDLYKARAEGD